MKKPKNEKLNSRFTLIGPVCRRLRSCRFWLLKVCKNVHKWDDFYHFCPVYKIVLKTPRRWQIGNKFFAYFFLIGCWFEIRLIFYCTSARASSWACKTDINPKALDQLLINKNFLWSWVLTLFTFKITGWSNWWSWHVHGNLPKLFFCPWGSSS